MVTDIHGRPETSSVQYSAFGVGLGDQLSSDTVAAFDSVKMP